MPNKNQHSQVHAPEPDLLKLAELLGDEGVSSLLAALNRIHHNKRNGNDTTKQRHKSYKEAGMYAPGNGVHKLQELYAYIQFERSSGFRHTVLMELERYGINTDDHTLDKVREAEMDLYAESQSSYYRARTEQNLSFMAPPNTFPTVRSKYAAIKRVSDLLNVNPKSLEKEYKRHRDGALMWPRFHAYLKQELGTPLVEITDPDWWLPT